MSPPTRRAEIRGKVSAINKMKKRMTQENLNLTRTAQLPPLLRLPELVRELSCFSVRLTKPGVQTSKVTRITKNRETKDTAHEESTEVPSQKAPPTGNRFYIVFTWCGVRRSGSQASLQS